MKKEYKERDYSKERKEYDVPGMKGMDSKFSGHSQSIKVPCAPDVSKIKVKSDEKRY